MHGFDKLHDVRGLAMDRAVKLELDQFVREQLARLVSADSLLWCVFVCACLVRGYLRRGTGWVN